MEFILFIKKNDRCKKVHQKAQKNNTKSIDKVRFYLVVLVHINKLFIEKLKNDLLF